MGERDYPYSYRIATIGGGTGMFNLLRGLVELNTPELITAVPGTWDDGGSSGLLRTELGILPVGDSRRCLVAMMEDDEAREYALELFEKRKGRHAIGNLVLAELEINNPGKGLDAARKLFGVRGEIAPVSNNRLRLIAKDERGKEIFNEHSLDERKNDPNFDPSVRLSSVYFTRRAKTNPKAEQALLEAQKRVISMGSLFGSILPHFSVPGITEAITSADAELFYVLNLMTETGQTDGLKASDHLRLVVQRLRDPQRLDYMIVGTNHLPIDILNKYKEQQQAPVVIDKERCLEIAPNLKILEVNPAPYRDTDHLVRHDPLQVAMAILDPNQFLRKSA